MAVGVEYHGGLGGMGGENTMVDGVKEADCTQDQYQRVCRNIAREKYILGLDLNTHYIRTGLGRG